jgi:lipopolysaccharide transport system permease protein
MSRPTVILEPTRGRVMPRLTESWHNRELLWYLTLRDVKVRYTQTLLGWAWALIQPIGLMLVFMFAFSRLGDVDTDGVPYPLFAITGLAFWTFFSRGLTQAADSLIVNQALLTKTSCPRLLLPLSGITSALFDLLLTIPLALVFVAAYGEGLSWHIALLPAVVFWGVLLAIGAGVILAGVNVRYRDVRNAMTFATMLVMFVSPVAFSFTGLAGTELVIASLNPVVGIVETFRWCLLDVPGPPAVSMWLSLGVTALLLAGGLTYYSRVARDFADDA